MNGFPAPGQGTAGCGHPAASQGGHCVEMACANYAPKCPAHATTPSAGVCNRFEAPDGTVWVVVKSRADLR